MSSPSHHSTFADLPLEIVQQVVSIIAYDTSDSREGDNFKSKFLLLSLTCSSLRAVCAPYLFNTIDVFRACCRQQQSIVKSHVAHRLFAETLSLPYANYICTSVRKLFLRDRDKYAAITLPKGSPQSFWMIFEKLQALNTLELDGHFDDSYLTKFPSSAPDPIAFTDSLKDLRLLKLGFTSPVLYLFLLRPGIWHCLTRLVYHDAFTCSPASSRSTHHEPWSHARDQTYPFLRACPPDISEPIFPSLETFVYIYDACIGTTSFSHLIRFILLHKQTLQHISYLHAMDTCNRSRQCPLSAHNHWWDLHPNDNHISMWDALGQLDGLKTMETDLRRMNEKEVMHFQGGIRGRRLVGLRLRTSTSGSSFDLMPSIFSTFLPVNHLAFHYTEWQANYDMHDQPLLESRSNQCSQFVAALPADHPVISVTLFDNGGEGEGLVWQKASVSGKDKVLSTVDAELIMVKMPDEEWVEIVKLKKYGGAWEQLWEHVDGWKF